MPKTKAKTWDGITVDGKPLNDFFTDQAVKDLPAVIEDEQKLKKNKKRRIYIRQKPDSEKQRRSKMTTADQATLNQQNLVSLLENTEAIAKRIVIYLLAGKDFTGQEFQEWQAKKGKMLSKQQVWSLLSSICRSGLGDFISRRKEVYKGNKMFRYALIPEGRILTPEQAFELLKQAPKPKSKKVVKKKAPVEKSKPKKREPRQSPDVGDVEINIKDALQTDLNLNVNGRVDVYFHFKLG
jgi:hypothetical protein